MNEKSNTGRDRSCTEDSAPHGPSPTIYLGMVENTRIFLGAVA